MDSPMVSCEVRYAGVVVGRATQVKDWTATGAFIGLAEPLPSGTRIELRGDNHVQAARVEQVFESADPNAAGMHVSFLASGSAAGPSTSAAAPATSAPASAPVAAPPPSGAVPVSEASPADSTGTAQPAHQGGGKRKRRR